MGGIDLETMFPHPISHIIRQSNELSSKIKFVIKFIILLLLTSLGYVAYLHLNRGLMTHSMLVTALE